MTDAENKRFSKNKEDFVCEICNAKVKGTGYTDHCPKCLWSKHVDKNPGDRKSECKGMMEPIKTEHDRKGFTIIYVCKKCGLRKRVKAAENDSKEMLMQLL